MKPTTSLLSSHLLCGIALGLLAPSVPAAPSTGARSIVGVRNKAVSPYITSLDDHFTNGAPVTAASSPSYTGRDRAGIERTMTFAGTTATSATYGRLRSLTTGAVQNSYYSDANPTYVRPDGTVNPAGSPDGLISLGFASFTDTLRFGGALQSGYRARYIFHVDGTNSGTGFLADLAVQIAGDPTESFFAFDEGFVSRDWATASHEVNGIVPQEISVQFSTQVVHETFALADGGTYSGVSDFSSTLTLAAIAFEDANGNPVSGVTVTSDSGTVYPVSAPVPEPGSLAALAGGLLAVLRRRRRPTA